MLGGGTGAIAPPRSQGLNRPSSGAALWRPAHRLVLSDARLDVVNESAQRGLDIVARHTLPKRLAEELSSAGDGKSDMPKPAAARLAVGFIHQRLITVEVFPAAVSLWQSITRE